MRGVPKGTVRIRQTMQARPVDRDEGCIVGDQRCGVHLDRLLDADDRAATGRPRSTSALSGPALQNGDWWRLFTYSTRALRAAAHRRQHARPLDRRQRRSSPEPARPGSRRSTSCRCSAAPRARSSRRPTALTGGASGGIFGVAAAATLVMTGGGSGSGTPPSGPCSSSTWCLGLLRAEHLASVVTSAGSSRAGSRAEAMMRARKIEMPRSVTSARERRPRVGSGRLRGRRVT